MAGKDNPAVLEAMKRAQEVCLSCYIICLYLEIFLIFQIASRITGGGGGNSFPLGNQLLSA